MSEAAAKPIKFGRYLLLDRIAVGGMAEVFRGKMQGVKGFERLVAIKKILPDVAADPDFIEMFVEEAKLAVQLQHASIAQIYDLGEVSGDYYIAMEYVSGTDLRTMWNRARSRNRLLPIAMSCHVIQKIAEGLDAAHRKKGEDGDSMGLVHRDVSPQNILVSFEGEVKLIDFGIAKAKNKVSKTQAGVLKGKFGYMSPEQVRGRDLDNRSDIFACGVVLYELLVGDRLFLGESDFSTLEKVRKAEMVPPTRLNKNLSPHLERIVMKALAKRREDRYRHASEVAEDLQRYLFSTNQPFARTDLQRYMNQHFKEDIEEETELLDRYRSITFAGFEETERSLPEARGISMRSAIVAPGHDSGSHNLPTQALRPMPTPGAAAAGPLPASTSNERPPSAAALQATPSISADRASPSLSGFSGISDVSLSPPRQGLPGWFTALVAVFGIAVVGGLGFIAYFYFIAAVGEVIVRVEPPDAEILIDDRVVANTTPFQIKLEPGTYVLKVKKDGYQEIVRGIRVEARESRMEPFTLRKAETLGALAVKTNPGGLLVWLDGAQKSGLTPLVVSQLPSGKHQVEVRRTDGTIVHRAFVDVVPDKQQELEIDVAQLAAVLDVRTEPAGAEVLINGNPSGNTPLALSDLPVDRNLRVELRMNGCRSKKTRVRLAKSTLTPVEIVLDCN